MGNLNDVNASQDLNVEGQGEQVQTNLETVNAGNGETTTPQVEVKPVQSAEDNAKFAEVRRKAESETRDKVIADMGYEWNGKPITTYDQYMKAKAEAEEQTRREELQEKGIDPTLIDEYVSNNPTVKWARDLQTRQEQEQKQKEEYSEFFEYFRKENGRDFNSATDTIPQNVWEENAKGKSLKDAYVYHYVNELKAKNAEYEAKLKATETNQTNASSTPGSVTGNGNAESNFFTAEQVRNMTKEQVKTHFNAIEESMKKW